MGTVGARDVRRVLVAGGTVYDPANGVSGEVRDILIEGGRVVGEFSGRPGTVADRVIDARGRVVMPGGVDLHSHVAGSKVNAGRALRVDEASRRRGDAEVPRFGEGFRGRACAGGSVPSTFATGYRYAGLGYTTAFDAAIAPMGARQAHWEFRDIPIVDRGFFALVGNNHYAMDRIRGGEADFDRLTGFLAWLLESTGAYGLKVVNPGGVERWKEGRGNVSSLDDEVEGFGVTPRGILLGLARAADALGLPHAAHIHCNNLGLPGNWETTLETMRALEGHRGHLTHIQFHSYGGSLDKPSSIRSRVSELAAEVNARPNLTVDVGQVVFGDTTSMTADGPVGAFLHRLTGRRWHSHDSEFETGCGVVPVEYEARNLVHATQWAIGMEWFLLVDDPWRIALTTDHPNGGSFLTYPKIIAALMSETLRSEILRGLPEKVRGRTILGDLRREYTLEEVAIATRAAPARILGLTRKGHLGPGADGDVTILEPDDDKERMFSAPRMVLKGGEAVLEEGDLRGAPEGRTLWTCRGYDAGAASDAARWFEEERTVSAGSYRLTEAERAEFLGEGRC